MSEPLCKNCVHRIKYSQHSECSFISQRYLINSIHDKDGAYPIGYEAEGISVDPNFGCIHFTPQ